MKAKIFRRIDFAGIEFFIKDKIIDRIESVDDYIVVYYYERKVIKVETSKLSSKEKNNLVEILPKLKFNDIENGTILDFTY